jgi:TMEM175 potassium channel family protein
MGKGRLEAFSDGVFAIIITIMVLELKVPHGGDLASLVPLIPKFLSYILSFVYLAIYWNNHHHLLHVTHRVTGGILWANLYLLFWLSLIPFATAWMGESHFKPATTALYGVPLLMAAIAYWVLTRTILKAEGEGSILSRALGSDLKGRGSILLYVAALFLAFLHPAIAGAIYVLVALIWLIPDRRIERALAEHEERSRG